MSDPEPEHRENGEPPAEDEPRTVMPSSGPDRDQMAAEYLPAQDDWLAKTVLDINDPHAVAALAQLGTLYPEVDELQPLVDEFTQDFLRGRTSIGGKSREEYQSIIQSLFGGNGEDAAKNVATLLGADIDD